MYVGGGFSTLDGQPRQYLGKLSASGNGAVDPMWDPGADNLVRILVADGNDAIYAAGDFLIIGGESRHLMSKLSASGTGAVDPDWNPIPDDLPTSMVLGSNNSIYVAGRFQNIGGQARRTIAKLSRSGTGAADPVWNPAPTGGVNALATANSGAVYAGGGFTSIGGQTRSDIAKLSDAGAGDADPAWDAGPVEGHYYVVNAMAMLGDDDDLAVGGSITSIDGQPRRGLAVLSNTGDNLPAVDTVQPGFVYALAAQPNGGMIVGGYFDNAGAQIRHSLLRLQVDGSLDPNWNPDAENGVLALATIGNETVFAGGGFSYVGGLPRASIAKLSGSGTGAVDPDWDPGADNVVMTLAVDGDGAVYAGGSFGEIASQPRQYLAKLSVNGSGAVDPTWNPNPDGNPFALAVGNDGSIYVAGLFQNIGGLPRNNLAKLSGSGSGSADPNWDPDPDSGVLALAVDTDGSVFAGGNFFNIGGQQRQGIAKLAGDGNGAADPLWNPLVGCLGGNSLVLDGNGALFASICSGARKLSTSGTGIDPEFARWNPQTNGSYMAIAQNATGNIYLGGLFTTVGNLPRGSVAAVPPTAPPEEIFADGFE